MIKAIGGKGGEGQVSSLDYLQFGDLNFNDPIDPPTGCMYFAFINPVNCLHITFPALAVAIHRAKNCLLIRRYDA